MKRIVRNHNDFVDRPILKINLSFFADGAGGEKTELPTQKKRNEAREEGQVAMSPEIATAILYLVIFNALKSFAPYIFEKMQEAFHISMENSLKFENIYNLKYMADFIGFFFLKAISAALPMLLIALVVGVVCSVLQVGWKPTMKPLKPKLSKISPIAGLKRLFSFRVIMNLFKSIAKLIVIGYVIITKLSEEINIIPGIMNMTFMDSVMYIGNIVVELGVTVGGWFLAIAVIDYAYQKFKHEKDLKMTKYEVKQEYKQSEGDPQIKGKIRQRMQEASMRRMMQTVPTADVIITNPTHYAVAIQYDRFGIGAPQVVAKGVDHLAARIKAIAKENNVEIVENVQLARTLYATVDIGKEIPPELFQAVAEILAFVYKLKNKI